MDNTRKLWITLGTMLVIAFSVLLFMGGEIYRKAPPMPDQVVGANGATLFERANIERGRQVWQSLGGMQLGSIWGHGAYVAPDWSADWVHREATAVLDSWSERAAGVAFEDLAAEQRAWTQRQAPRIDPPQHLRSRDTHHHARCRPGCRNQQRRRALRKPVRERRCHGVAARRLCDEGRHGAGRGESPCPDRLFLVDLPGLR
jgi:hypothetical protein